MQTLNTVTSTAVYFPVAKGRFAGHLDQCCVCGKVGQFGDFSMSMFSAKSYCDAHLTELNAEVQAGEKAAKK